MIGVSNSKITKYITKIEAESEFVPKTDFDSSVIENILNSINILNNEVVDINTDITNINSEINTTNSNVSTNTINIENNSNDISDLSLQVNQNTNNIATNTTNISTNTTNITTNTTDITELKSRMTTAESNITNNTTNITSNTTNITKNTTDINKIKNNLYDALYRPFYVASPNRAAIEYNYDLGKLYYALVSSSTFESVINNNSTDYHLNDDIESLILPGTIKQLNSSAGSVRLIINKIIYKIVEATDSAKKNLSNLKTITVLPDVYLINFNLNAAGNLTNFNLFEGLQSISLTGFQSSGSDTQHLINLTIPASVTYCYLKNIKFGELIFNGRDKGNTEDTQPVKLQLVCTNVWVEEKFKCLRRLTDYPYTCWTLTDNAIPAPSIVEISTETFGSLFSSTVNFGAGQATRTTVILHMNWNSGMPGNMSFHRVINMTSLSSEVLSNTSFPSAIIVG